MPISQSSRRCEKAFGWLNLSVSGYFSLLGVLQKPPSTKDEWNDVHIGHTMRLLSAGTYGGARLQAGAIRTPELRRSYIRYVDECSAAAMAGAYDDERLYAAAAD